MRKLTGTYLVALSFIAIVIGISQYLVQKSIQTVTYDARTINISGRQSMLSQLISKTAIALQIAEDSGVFEVRKKELKEAVRLWEISQNALQYGDEELQIDHVNNSESIYLLFLNLEKSYLNIKSAVGYMLAIEYTQEGKAELLESQTARILENESEYLEAMSAITLLYDEESTERLSDLSRTEYILLMIAIGILLVEALFVFRPMIKNILEKQDRLTKSHHRIKQFAQKLIKQDKDLKNLLVEQKREKTKVEYLNQQARTVFNNVEQGIFLMNRQYMISQLHSSALESIFGVEDLSGKNFIQLIRPRLLPRDQQALEMFVKLLFNPKI